MDKEVINMENIGVTCDVCACCHNVDGCKCDLPQIKVTEQCSCCLLYTSDAADE